MSAKLFGGPDIHVVPAGTLIMADGRAIRPGLTTPELRADARHVVTDKTMIVGTTGIWLTPEKYREVKDALRQRTRK